MCRNLLTNDGRKQYVQPFEYIKLRFSSWNIQGTEKDAPKASLLLLDVTIWIFSTLKICVPKDYSLTLFTRNVIAASPGSLKKCCWEQCNIVLIEIFTKTRKSKCSNYKINAALSHLGSFQQRRSLLTQTGAIPALNEVKLRSSRELQCLKMRHCFSVETPLKQIKRVKCLSHRHLFLCTAFWAWKKKFTAFSIPSSCRYTSHETIQPTVFVWSKNYWDQTLWNRTFNVWNGFQRSL